MKESNEFLLEGLPSEYNNNNKSLEEEKVEEEEEEEENDNEGVFIHDIDELQKSMINDKRQTLLMPKSRLKIDESNTIELQRKKLEQDDEENNLEMEDENALDNLRREQDINNDSGLNYLNIDQILSIEDPFMRVSRPLNYKNYRTSYNRMAKTMKKAKKKKKFFFKQKPQTVIQNKFSSTSKSEEDSKTDKSESTEKSGKKERKESDDEEEEIEDEGNEFIDVTRPSFISRNSIDLEYNNVFEVEVVDSVWMTVLQVINCMIKANLVQIAISMKELGLIWGPITICLIAIMSLISLNLILEVNKMTGQRSYLIFSEIIFGHFGSVVILICQFMSAFGGCFSFIVIFNKVIPKILSFSITNQYISDDKIFSSILAVLLLFYCYKQDVNILKAAAKYAVFAILLFFVVTIIDFCVAIFSQDRLISLNNTWNKNKKYEILYGLNRSDYEFKERLSNIITAVACIILSYSFHIFTFSIYGCMGKISRKQFFITTSVSVLITTIIYLICGTIGYLLYYDNLKDSILDAIEDSWLSYLLSLANVINVIMTFPITFSAVKNYFLLFIGIMATLTRDFFLWAFRCVPKVNNLRERISNARISKVWNKDNKSFLMSGKPLVKIPKVLEVILTLFIYVVIFWFASVFTQLKIIFSLTGGVMGNILSFIFPSIFYLGFAKKKAFSKYGIVAVFFIIFGLVTMGICITSTIQSSKSS